MTAPSPEPSITTSEAIRFERVSVRFGGVRALDDVSFSVGRGEVHCLAGENGSGKSTLIKVIAGVYQAAPGARTDYFGESVAAPTPQLARAKGVAVIWQDLALVPGNDGRGEHRLRGPRGRAAAGELSRHPRNCARRARQARRRARPQRAAQDLQISGDKWWRSHARSRATQSSSSWTSPPPRSRRPRRTSAHVVRTLRRVRRRRGLRQPSTRGGVGRVESRHRSARRTIGRAYSPPRA